MREYDSFAVDQHPLARPYTSVIVSQGIAGSSKGRTQNGSPGQEPKPPSVRRNVREEPDASEPAPPKVKKAATGKKTAAKPKAGSEPPAEAADPPAEPPAGGRVTRSRRQQTAAEPGPSAANANSFPSPPKVPHLPPCRQLSISFPSLPKGLPPPSPTPPPSPQFALLPLLLCFLACRPSKMKGMTE